ncbi:Peptidase family M23 [Geodermatophilus pulveris]|uniref:Peptidase family M23 n=1 Tax=Geodermatophilus pulveris TaxID=1564159 RepID=A0A239DPH3_9ACTN|nr:M23 family metallopeptidase [Geodermatophilus pulveris]SNS33798.1 Peptidase family M23 [Geodermatophilus pulveris]
MTQLHHDRPLDLERTSRPTLPTRRPEEARRSDTPPAARARLAGVADPADLTGRAEAAARSGITGGPAAAVTPLLRRLRGRRAVHVAAALVGASALGLVTAGEPVARARETRAGTAGPVSVAQELGLHAGAPAAVPDAEAAARLGELAADRTVREAGRTAAAAAQAEADRVAAEADRLAAEAARPEAVLPVEGGRLTSGFGSRWGTLHAGIDLAAPMRTPEYAAMDGIVLEAGPASGYGLAVYVRHANGDVTVYGHMDEVLVTPGQVVRAGDTIALLGNRGQSTGPHLHFEVRRGGPGGEPVDPVAYLRERGVGI